MNGQASGSPASAPAGTQFLAAAGNDFRLSYPPDGASSAEWDGQLDECFVDNVAWSVSQVCRAGRCQLDGSLCMCDPGTPANYLTCTVDANCRVSGNTTAICDTSAGTCRGRDPGGVNCTPTSCNASAP